MDAPPLLFTDSDGKKGIGDTYFQLRWVDIKLVVR